MFFRKKRAGTQLRHQDPVCAMLVNETAPFKEEYGGQIYYFCSESCKRKFDLNPEAYAVQASLPLV